MTRSPNGAGPPDSLKEGEVSQSQPCGEASADAEVFAGLQTAPSGFGPFAAAYRIGDENLHQIVGLAPAASAAMDANFWKAEWHKLDAIRDDLREALQETWRVLRLAGTLNLSNGVQLGQTAWYVKISDAEKLADAALAKATGLPVQPPIDNRKWGDPDVV